MCNVLVTLTTAALPKRFRTAGVGRSTYHHVRCANIHSSDFRPEKTLPYVLLAVWRTAQVTWVCTSFLFQQQGQARQPLRDRPIQLPHDTITYHWHTMTFKVVFIKHTFSLRNTEISKASSLRPCFKKKTQDTTKFEKKKKHISECV